MREYASEETGAESLLSWLMSKLQPREASIYLTDLKVMSFPAVAIPLGYACVQHLCCSCTCTSWLRGFSGVTNDIQTQIQTWWWHQIQKQMSLLVLCALHTLPPIHLLDDNSEWRNNFICIKMCEKMWYIRFTYRNTNMIHSQGKSVFNFAGRSVVWSRIIVLFKAV